MSTVTEPLHDDEIPVDLPLVRALVDRAFPGYADLQLSRLATSGSSNALFRLGADLLVRLPRQPGGTATIDKEARWLPYVGRALPAAVPEIVAVGDPAFGYPERWSVVRWITGDVPKLVAPDAAGRHHLAQDLAGVVTSLGHIDVPTSALHDPQLRWYRGDPLVTRDAQTRRDIDACQAIHDLGLDLDAALDVWDEAMALPGVDRETTPRWYHGDLAAENLLVRHGRLTAVLDFGGLAVGDPTIDLVVAWELFAPPDRDVFRTATGVDDETWLRARGWALSLALMTFPYYWRTMPERCASRLAMARAVLADAAST